MAVITTDDDGDPAAGDSADNDAADAASDVTGDAIDAWYEDDADNGCCC